MSRRGAVIDAERVVVIRTDRIGDLILSTPLFEAIKTASPRCEITAVGPPYALPVLEENPHVDRLVPWTGSARDLAETLRPSKAEGAIVLNPSWRSCYAVRLAGVPFRTGPLSRPSSFLLLPHGLRQRRSRSGRHQSELDTAFASLVTGGRASGTPPPLIQLRPEESEEARRSLDEAGIHTGSRVVGIHAGSGDSALRWPESRYAELGRLFRDDRWTVLFTGGAGEVDLSRRLAADVGEGALSIAADRPLRAFFGLLSQLDLFVAPSTGPLHAAVALGLPVASPFPPLPSQSPARWGPRSAWTAVVAPEVECPATIRCRGKRCRLHPCMEEIDARALFVAALDAFDRKRRSG